MNNPVDARGVPERHTEARDTNEHGPDHKGPALARYCVAHYTNLPLMPEPVAAARTKMDDAANLVRELDEAAFDLLGEYRAAPREAARKARESVAAGKKPESTEKLDKRLDSLAMKYRDAVVHRKAVESHLIGLVDAYHAEAEACYPAWRDAIAAELHDRAEPARVKLATALTEARAVYGLAMAVEAMDRPHNRRDERPRVSALRGKQVPDALQVDTTRGKGNVHYVPDSATVGEALDEAGMLASVWLRVEGNAQLGQGPIPEALTVPVSDMPNEDAEANRARDAHRREQLERARRIGMNDKRAREVFGL